MGGSTDEEWDLCKAEERLVSALCLRSAVLKAPQTAQARSAPPLSGTTFHTLKMYAEPLRRDKGYLVHVGGLCPSVSEICISCFPKKKKKNSDIKMAVKEMNGAKKIHTSKYIELA
ncbi:uncharacterized protein [Eulemur rufifrons]|uniref:uncharacterized protein n=1 Tax=Eulemur rufifrons TaxID=859984 RepID=UPI0037447BA8